MHLEWSLALTGEMLTFGLLGKAFYTYPERPWVRALVDEDVFAEAPFAAEQPDVIAALGLLQAWSQAHKNGISDEAFDNLRADYTRLFIGPGKVLTPPWESVQFSEERLTFQEQTLQVRGWYQRFGLAAEKLYAEPDDHIGLELEFVAQLARLGLAALEENDQTKFKQLLDGQRGFLSEHLLKWGPAWCSQVADQAQTDFYRGIALLTRGALAEISNQ
ncbi:MAG: molecular chaperone TorD family protein [Chloroflexi bacterium]|nr:molecular chaperone TorD family protein [Chloroflexota bacterium]